MESENSKEEKATTVYNVTMDIILCLAVGYYFYVVMDEVTDGQFSREVSVRVTKIRGRIRTEIERNNKFRKLVGPVLFDAITTVEDAGNIGGDTITD